MMDTDHMCANCERNMEQFNNIAESMISRPVDKSKLSYLSGIGKTIGSAVKRNERLLTGATIGVVGTSVAFIIYGKIKNKDKKKKIYKETYEDIYEEVEQDKRQYKVTLQSKDGRTSKRTVLATNSEEAKEIVIKSLMEYYKITDVSLA